MNKQQRKQLAIIESSISHLAELEPNEAVNWAEAIEKLEDALSNVQEIRDEEQDKFDNLPEGLQASGKGDDIQSAIDALDSAVTDLEAAIESAKGKDSNEDKVESVSESVQSAIDSIGEVM